MTDFSEVSTKSPFQFDTRRDFVDDYDRNVRMFMPGYEASHDLAAVLLDESGRAGKTGDLLAIGAGGGGELARFASALPGWRFTAVDPSAAMLDRARVRLDREGAVDRSTLIQGTSHDAPAGPFDAATAFLALQFVADDGERLAQLRAIHARLRPGAPFMVINCATDDFERDQRRYVDHARLRGAEAAMIAEAVSMQRTHVHFLTPAREEALLAEAGFTQVEQFYQAFWVRGWSATA